MKISVIVPVYNAENTIADTLKSVIDQQRFGFTMEVIVVDDGSTDHSAQVIKELPFDLQYYHQVNAGVSAARNFGYAKSTGDFIQYVDSDDLLAEDKLSIQLNLLVNANADVAYGAFQKFQKQGDVFKYLEIIDPIIPNHQPELEIFKSTWCPPAALLFRRSLCDNIGGWNTSLPVIQDARYLFDAANQGALFVKQDGITSYYNVGNESSLSRKSLEAFVDDCFLNARQVHELWKSELSNERLDALLHTLRYCANEYSKYSRAKHREVVDFIVRLVPDYIPQQGKFLAILSKMFGYRTAEDIAYYKRRLLK